MTGIALERRIVALAFAVQFVNILDFMMVMPLGPDFALALGFPASEIGWVGGSYTASACIAGLLATLVLDRFDRRRALAVLLLGLVIATALGGFAQGLPSLIAARVLAGAFGGPASALVIAIVSDNIPASRRGRAMGAVAGAFALSSVLGVPVGLELAHLGGWRLPFFSVAGLGAVVALVAIAILPPQRAHLEDGREESPAEALGVFLSIIARRQTQLAAAMMVTIMTANFAIIPNIASYLMFNLDFPRERLGLLYLIGGFFSFFTMRLAGRLVDRFGAWRVGLVASAMTALVIWAAFVAVPPPISVLVLFPAFMVFSSARMIAASTTVSKVPPATERARFMALVSAIQHAASAFGAFLSSAILTEGPGGRLERMSAVAGISILLALSVPFLLRLLERGLKEPSPAIPPGGGP